MKSRIIVADLPLRGAEPTDEALDQLLLRVGAVEGSACKLDCDCRIGLICANGTCATKD